MTLLLSFLFHIADCFDLFEERMHCFSAEKEYLG